MLGEPRETLLREEARDSFTLRDEAEPGFALGGSGNAEIADHWLAPELVGARQRLENYPRRPTLQSGGIPACWSKKL
jgi:hypothetical protein